MRWWLLVLVLGALGEARDVLRRFNDDGCYVMVARELRLERGHVDSYVMADTLRDCERACDQAFFACKSFSFSPNRGRENENCLLSRDDSTSLSLSDFRHFYRDQDFTFYERSYGRLCGSEIINNIYDNECCDGRRVERVTSPGCRPQHPIDLYPLHMDCQETGEE